MDAFQLVVGTDFIVHLPEVEALPLTQPDHLVLDDWYRPEEHTLERSRKQPYNVHLIETLVSEENRMLTAFEHESYQLDPQRL